MIYVILEHTSNQGWNHGVALLPAVSCISDQLATQAIQAFSPILASARLRDSIRSLGNRIDLAWQSDRVIPP